MKILRCPIPVRLVSVNCPFAWFSPCYIGSVEDQVRANRIDRYHEEAAEDVSGFLLWEGGEQDAKSEPNATACIGTRMGAAAALSGLHLGAARGDQAVLQHAALYPRRFHAGKEVIAIAEEEMTLAPEPVPITSDPWMTTLANWSLAVLGSPWNVYCGMWPPDVAAPAVMWRMIGMDVRALGPSSYEIQKRMTAFLRAEDADQEHAAVLRLLEGLGSAVKIPLDAAAKRYLRVVDPKLSLQPEETAEGAAVQGPLTVTLLQRRTKPVVEAPLMQAVFINPK